MSGYIPKEQLAAYQRWEVDAFDAPARPKADRQAPEQAFAASTPPPETIAPPNPALPTAEELEAIYNEAQHNGYEAGFAAGQEAGQQAAMAQVEEKLGHLETLANNFRQALLDLDQVAADQLLHLSLEIARQVLRSELHAHPENLAAVVREGLAALPLNHGPVALHVSPEDASLIGEHLGELFTQSGRRIIEDSAVTPGGCRLLAGASEVDATIETRWKRVLESIGAPEPPALDNE